MTKSATKSLPGSRGGLGLTAGFMAHLLLNPLPSSSHGFTPISPSVNYTLSLSTYGEHADIFAVSNLAASPGGDALANFYTDLLTGQERLGREFEQVLFENLWELYAR